MKREIIAFLIAPTLAPVIPAAVFAITSGLQMTDMGLLLLLPQLLMKFIFMAVFMNLLAWPLSYGLAVCVGLPVYLVLKDTNRVSYYNLLVAGSLIGLLPVLILGSDLLIYSIPMFVASGALVASIFWLILGTQPFTMTVSDDTQKRVGSAAAAYTHSESADNAPDLDPRRQ